VTEGEAAMTKTVYATYLGGDVLRLEAPMELPPNTRVKLTVDSSGGSGSAAPRSFLDVVQELNLDGPSDWSTRLHEHLYGDDTGR
jgi:hypothetical protein